MSQKQKRSMLTAASVVVSRLLMMRIFLEARKENTSILEREHTNCMRAAFFYERQITWTKG